MAAKTRTATTATTQQVGDSLEMFDEGGIDHAIAARPPQQLGPPPVTPSIAPSEPVMPVAPRRKRWRVTLECPTPLEHRELEVEAADEVAARAAFCAANNISGSAHPWTIDCIG